MPEGFSFPLNFLKQDFLNRSEIKNWQNKRLSSPHILTLPLCLSHTKTVPRGKATFHPINPQTKKIPPLYLWVSVPGCRIPLQEPDPGAAGVRQLKFKWVAGSFMCISTTLLPPLSFTVLWLRERDLYTHTYTQTAHSQPQAEGSGFTSRRNGNLITKQF